MEKNEIQVLGVMSGTSLDGIDLAWLKFWKNTTWHAEIIKAGTVPYSKSWKTTLSKAVFYNSSQLQDLNEEYTNYLAQVISDFIEEQKIENLAAVCSHGHTIKHEPENGFTLQIGNLPKLAQLVKQTVLCDFRVQDVQLGGQGAPLVPIGDKLLFNNYQFCLNLGGFANVSTEINETRIAYDICAVNTVLNFLAEKLNLDYDKDGAIAASGSLDHDLLEKLDRLTFYEQQPPKSLGIEWVNQQLIPLLKDTKDIPSVLHTYCVHVGKQISRTFDQNPNSRVLITGGGAFNSFLIQQIEKHTTCEIVIPAPELVNYKEALIFGLLGVLKLHNQINVLKSVTGASKDHSSGFIYTGIR